MSRAQFSSSDVARPEAPHADTRKNDTSHEVNMPPKAATAESDGAENSGAKFGRVKNNLKMGIVGLPNVGKSSLFNLLTKTSIAASENYPFCTIDPNEARHHRRRSVFTP